MSFIGISVPQEIAKKLAKVKVPGKKEDEDNFHITIAYFDGGLDFKKASKIMEIMHKTLSAVKPFELLTKKIKCFSSKGKTPIICEIEGKELFKLEKIIKKALDEKNIQYSILYPDYNPHITLAYADEEIKSREFNPIKFEVFKITYFAGDYKNNNLNIDFILNDKCKSALDKKAKLFEGMTK